jgi:hypothetical protein
VEDEIVKLKEKLIHRLPKNLAIFKHALLQIRDELTSFGKGL